MPQVHLREAERERYVHITSDDKEVLVMCPLVGGSTIGTDNTCQSVKEMAKFFGKTNGSDENRESGVHKVTRYAETVGHDVEILQKLRPLFKHSDMAHAALIEQKTSRQARAQKYAAALLRMTQSDNELNCLSGNYPTHPPTVKTVMSRSPTNLGSMLLCPSSTDSYTRFDHMASFRLSRNNSDSGFPAQLRSAVANTGSAGSQNPMDRLKAKASERYGTSSQFDWAAFKTSVTGDISSLFGMQVSLEKSREDVENTMGMDGDEPAAEWVEGLVGLAEVDLSHVDVCAPLATVSSSYKATLLQIFLGIVGLHAKAHHGFTADLGRTLEQNAQAHARAIATKAASQSPETDVISYLVASCGVPSSINADADKLTRLANECWLTVKGSPHFDEFCLISHVRGQATVLHNCLSLDLSTLLVAKPQWAGPDRAFFERCAAAFTRAQSAHAANGDITLAHTNAEAIGGAVGLSFDNLHSLPRDQATGVALAKLLLCKEDGKSQPFFATLSDAWFTDILDVFPSADLQAVMLPQMGDQESLDAFRARFVAEGKDYKRLTRANARSIYHVVVTYPSDVHDATALDGLDNRQAPNKMNRALEIIAAAQGWAPGAIGRVYMSNTLAGYTVECTPAARAAVDEICNRPITFHLTPDVARSVYITATEQRGAAYCEQAFQGLSNSARPDKISKALELVGVDMAQMQIAFHGRDGYDVTCSAELAQQIDDFHQHVLNPPRPDQPNQPARRNIRGLTRRFFGVPAAPP